jgi:gliding motility-associated-like protein
MIVFLRVIYSVVMICIVIHLPAQLVLDRQVIAAGGMQSTGPLTVDASIGQPITYTVSNNAGILTQGFHQPSDMTTLNVNVAVYETTCSGTYDVRILSVDGCDDLSGIMFYWDNVPGGMIKRDLQQNCMLYIATNSGCEHSIYFDFPNYPNKIINTCEIEFYTYISPNNDGDNDVWRIKNADTQFVQSIHVEMYNRWGARVWRSDVYDNVNHVWKGDAQDGSALPDGTYYYVAKINETTYNGYVELIR